jgi:cob(I)alamin adenosyltransferase
MSVNRTGEEGIEMLLQKGYIHVYTGNGKGKTTAALGLAFRAMGMGLRSYIAQFLKGQQYGELESALMVSPHITIEQFGKDSIIHGRNACSAEDVEMANRGLQKAKEEMLSGHYNIIILDEVTVANDFNLLTTTAILDFVKEKPSSVELVLTGRYAAKEIIEAADLVTEMQEVKHYFQKGIQARNGIEK